MWTLFLLIVVLSSLYIIYGFNQALGCLSRHSFFNRIESSTMRHAERMEGLCFFFLSFFFGGGGVEILGDVWEVEA